MASEALQAELNKTMATISEFITAEIDRARYGVRQSTPVQVILQLEINHKATEDLMSALGRWFARVKILASIDPVIKSKAGVLQIKVASFKAIAEKG